MFVNIKQKKKNRKKQRSVATLPPASKREVSVLGKAIRTLGTALGGAGGAMLGAPGAGGIVGNSLAGALSRWIGTGDYSINNNSVVQRSLKAASSIPSMHSDAQSVVVRHKEYLGEILSSQTFSVQQSYPLNPGVSTTFPWLSGIASRFQEYKIRGLVFHYIPTSGSAVSSTNAALGSVMLQTSYRATDALPGSKVEILNEYCSNEVVPCETMAHPVECDPKENPFNVQYVRTGAVPGSDTQLMYDLGVTHVAVSGCQSVVPVVLGDLWVTYEIELKKPLVASNVTSTTSSCSGIVTTSVSATSPFGPTTRTLTGPMAATVQTKTITLPKGSVGQYAIFLYITGASLAISMPGITFVECSNLIPINGDTITYLESLAGSTIVVIYTAITVVNPAANPTITFNTLGSGSLTATRVAVTQIA